METSSGRERDASAMTVTVTEEISEGTGAARARPALHARTWHSLMSRLLAGAGPLVKVGDKVVIHSTATVAASGVVFDD